MPQTVRLEAVDLSRASCVFGRQLSHRIPIDPANHKALLFGVFCMQYGGVCIGSALLNA
jgi:hypothetical protein